MSAADNLKQIKENTGDAEVIAVSKYTSMNEVVTAYYAGQRSFGESKVQELIRKSKEAQELGLTDIEWHFIGRLQTNKVKQLLGILNLKYIHSVDSFKLLKEIYKRKKSIPNNDVFILFQVNTSEEEEKAGFTTQEEISEAVNFVLSQKEKTIHFTGLMTMSKLRTEDFEADARYCFKKLKKIKLEIENYFPIANLKLSMGMSQDYKIAVEEGADFVRIGSAIFNA